MFALDEFLSSQSCLLSEMLVDSVAKSHTGSVTQTETEMALCWKVN